MVLLEMMFRSNLVSPASRIFSNTLSAALCLASILVQAIPEAKIR